MKFYQGWNKRQSKRNEEHTGSGNYEEYPRIFLKELGQWFEVTIENDEYAPLKLIPIPVDPRKQTYYGDDTYILQPMSLIDLIAAGLLFSIKKDGVYPDYRDR